MGLKLALEDHDGQTRKLFAWDGKSAEIIFRKDSRRIELRKDSQELINRGVPCLTLGEIDPEKLKTSTQSLNQFGNLRVIEEVERLAEGPQTKEETTETWKRTILLMVVFGLIGAMTIVGISQIPPEEKPVEEVKEVIDIEKLPKAVIRVTPRSKRFQAPSPVKRPVVAQRKPRNVSKIGALAALGELSKGTNKGGIKVDAAKVSAGPGLGGTQGSGGVQQNIYAKGLMSAPLGAGANMEGAGGYGTKGAGGGQAGYGNMSLVGTSGPSVLTPSRGIKTEGYLDRDLIAQVVRKNLGQIRFCYEQGLQLDPKLRGRVVVSWGINSSGGVQSASVKSSSINQKNVEECVVSRLKTWKFPKPNGSGVVKVSYPFVLKRAGV